VRESCAREGEGMREAGGRVPVLSLSRWAVGRRKKDAPRTPLEERRLDGTRYFCVIALDVVRARALYSQR
jgi:hypothetical protein